MRDRLDVLVLHVCHPGAHVVECSNFIFFEAGRPCAFVVVLGCLLAVNLDDVLAKCIDVVQLRAAIFPLAFEHVKLDFRLLGLDGDGWLWLSGATLFGWCMELHRHRFDLLQLQVPPYYGCSCASRQGDLSS